MPANDPAAYSDPNSPHYNPNMTNGEMVKADLKSKKKKASKFKVRTNKERGLAEAAKRAMDEKSY